MDGHERRPAAPDARSRPSGARLAPFAGPPPAARPRAERHVRLTVSSRRSPMSSSTLTKRELREQRRAERQAAEAAEAAHDRRRRRLWQLGAAAGLALVAVVVAVAVSSSSGTPRPPAARQVDAVRRHPGAQRRARRPEGAGHRHRVPRPAVPDLRGGVEDHAADAGQRLRPHRQGEAAGAHAALHRRRLRPAPPRRPPAPSSRASCGRSSRRSTPPRARRTRATSPTASCAPWPRPPASTPAKRGYADAPSAQGMTKADAEANAAPRQLDARRFAVTKSGKTTVIGSGVLEDAGRARRRRSRDEARCSVARRASAGLGIAAYLTIVHYAGGEPVCAIAHGCATVQKSRLRGARRRARSRCSGCSATSPSWPRSPATASARARWRRS